MMRSRTTLGWLALVALSSLTGSTRAADDAAAKTAAAIRTAQTWKDGDSAEALNYLAEEVLVAARQADRKQALETQVLAGLAGARTRGAKDFFCRQLVIIGSAAAVPELAKLLPDAEASHLARYALARIPGPAADAALLEALGKVDDKLKLGMIQSLGTRGCREAVAQLALLAGGQHPELAAAALKALSRIDSDAAVSAVARTRESVPADLKAAATDAYLECAARLVKRGQAAEAAAIYQKLFAASEPPMARVAALNGLVAAQQGQAIAAVIAALNDPSVEVRRVAAAALRYVPGAEATQAIVAALAGKSEEMQVMLLAVLADRNDGVALAAVIKLADASSPAVRVAALTALSTLGDASVVPLLAQRAAAAKDAEQAAARASLTGLRGAAINAEIAGQLRATNAIVRIEAARALAARGATAQTPALFGATSDHEPNVAVEAWKALRTLANAQQLPTLVKLLVATKEGGVRGEAENAVVAAAATGPAVKNPAEAVLAALPAASEAEIAAALVRILGRLGHAAALPALKEALKDSRADVKDAAVRALADWPTAEPIETLRGLSLDPAVSLVHRILALRGFVNQISKQANASDEQILNDYAQAIRTASRNEEKQLVLSKLSLVRDRRALALAKSLASDPALKASAEAALANIEKLLAMPARVSASHSPEKAGQAIDKDPNTRWDTGGAQVGGEWFKIELDGEQLISGLVLDAQGSDGDYPRGYEVYVSAGSLGDGQLVAKGQGTSAVTKIVFAKPVRGKALKIVQTGQASGLFWSIHELTIEAKPVEQK